MGNCCSQPEVVEVSKPPPPKPSLHEDLPRSLSFVQGLKVIPSVATIDTPGQKGALSSSVYTLTHSWDGLFAACLFHGFGEQAAEVPALTRSVCDSFLWSKQDSPEASARALLTRVHEQLIAAGKGSVWAVGTVVLGDLSSGSVTCARVGCCSALLSRVTGSFAQATASGIPLTGAGPSRQLLSQLLQNPTDPAAQQAARGHVLGLSTAQDAPATSRRTTSGSTTDAAQRDQSGSTYALYVQVERQALTNTHPYIILCSDPIASLLSEPDLACLAHHFNPQHIQLLRDAAAKSGRQAPQSTAEAQQAGGAVEASGPRFNLAGLLLSYALAQPGLHRDKCARDGGLWRRQVMANAEALGFVEPMAAMPAKQPPPLPVGPPAVLALALQWPLSLTSRQVWMMRGVAADRAEHPRADKGWHMVRQLVRHMTHHRRRTRQLWDDTLKDARAYLQRDKRATEVLAWKHLSEAVIVSKGGKVVRSSAGADPGTPSDGPSNSGSPARIVYRPARSPANGSVSSLAAAVAARAQQRAARSATADQVLSVKSPPHAPYPHHATALGHDTPTKSSGACVVVSPTNDADNAHQGSLVGPAQDEGLASKSIVLEEGSPVAPQRAPPAAAPRPPLANTRRAAASAAVSLRSAARRTAG